MKHRTFALIVFVLLVIVVVANRTATGDKPLLQDTLTLLLTDDALAAELAHGDGAEDVLRQRFAPYLTNAALRDFFASESVRRLPLCLRRAGVELALGKVSLTQAENASGYIFTLPLHCERADGSLDFTLTGYAAFDETRLTALSLDDTGALERWLAGA